LVVLAALVSLTASQLLACITLVVAAAVCTILKPLVVLVELGAAVLGVTVT
jgi:hypothetical protein